MRLNDQEDPEYCNGRRVGTWGCAVLFGLAYFALAKAGHWLSEPAQGGSLTTIWLPSGLYVAALYLAHRRAGWFVLTAPLILSWPHELWPAIRRCRPARALEYAVLLGGLFLLTAATLTAQSGRLLAVPYLALPFLVWAALRFGPLGTSAAFVVLSLSSFWYATKGPGAAISRPDDLLQVELFLCMVVISFLILAGVTAERRSVSENPHGDQAHRQLAVILWEKWMIIPASSPPCATSSNRWPARAGRRWQTTSAPIAQPSPVPSEPALILSGCRVIMAAGSWESWDWPSDRANTTRRSND